MEALTYFVTARHGVKDDRAWGLVELVAVEGSTAKVVQCWTDAGVAKRAQAFEPLQAVVAGFDHRMTARGPRSELVSLEAA